MGHCCSRRDNAMSIMSCLTLAHTYRTPSGDPDTTPHMLNVIHYSKRHLSSLLVTVWNTWGQAPQNTGYGISSWKRKKRKKEKLIEGTLVKMECWQSTHASTQYTHVRFCRNNGKHSRQAAQANLSKNSRTTKNNIGINMRREKHEIRCLVTVGAAIIAFQEQCKQLSSYAQNILKPTMQ